MPVSSQGADRRTYTINEWLAYFHLISRTFVIPDRYDLQDCVQECCVELSELITEVDPTDELFSDRLKIRIFRRLSDLRSRERAQRRDYRVTVPFTATVEGSVIDDADPFLVAEARDLQQVIESRLEGPIQRTVFRELVCPSETVGQAMLRYCQTREKTIHDIPVTVLAETTGFSPRQVRYALDVIRTVSSRILAGRKPHAHSQS